MAMVDGGYQEAEALAMEGLRIARRVDDQIDTAMILGFLGTYALWQGDLETADRWAEQCLTCAQDLGDSGWIAGGHELLGYINLERENYPKAQQYLNESLQGFWRGREAMMCAECLEGLAGAAAGLGHHERGARLLGVAAALRERIGSPVPPPRQDRYDRTAVAIRNGLSDAEFQLAEADGRSWALDAAIAYALEPLDAAEPAPAAEAFDMLTRREIEVLRLVVDGRSNQEIADALVISPHTAIRHVANIMNKISVDSRTAAAAWAIRQGVA
jgi:DNA-binding CsgD family transcriptional regulator